MYKILKHRKDEGVEKGFWVNDSEGLPMEFPSFESASVIARMFKENTQHGYEYVVIFLGENNKKKKQILHG